MEKDKHKTNVQFYVATYEAIEEDEQPFKEVLAVFIDKGTKTHEDTLFDCYAHLGQHSICAESFLAEKCKKATKKQYQELFNELTSLNYNLEVL